MSSDDLTFLQKVALEGEVAYTLSTAPHDAEIKYRIYLILKEVEPEYKPFLLEAFKNSVTFSTEIVDRIYMETLLDEPPVWLWVDKVIADIKESVSLADVGITSSKTSICKVDERKKIIESAFVAFARKAVLVSPIACCQLFDAMEKEYELLFLQNSVFYLKRNCEELMLQNKEDKVPTELLNYTFDIRDFLDIRVETKALELLSKKKGRKRHSFHSVTTSTPDGTIVNINEDTAPEELSDIIAKKFAELMDCATGQCLKNPEQVSYVVEKRYNDTDLKTDIRTCKTMEEAVEFINKIKKEYPELQKTCTFIISKQEKSK